MRLKQLSVLVAATALSASGFAVTQNTLVMNAPSGATYVPAPAPPAPPPASVALNKGVPIGAFAAASVAAIASAPLGGVAGAAILGGALGSAIHSQMEGQSTPLAESAPAMVAPAIPVAASAPMGPAARPHYAPLPQADGAVPASGSVFTPEAFEAMRMEKALQAARNPALLSKGMAPAAPESVQAQPAQLRKTLDSKPAPARVGPNKRPLAVVSGD